MAVIGQPRSAGHTALRPSPAARSSSRTTNRFGSPVHTNSGEAA